MYLLILVKSKVESDKDDTCSTILEKNGQILFMRNFGDLNYILAKVPNSHKFWEWNTFILLDAWKISKIRWDHVSIVHKYLSQ